MDEAAGRLSLDFSLDIGVNLVNFNGSLSQSIFTPSSDVSDFPPQLARSCHRRSGLIFIVVLHVEVANFFFFCFR